MDLEIRTGLSESRKLSTSMGITIPRDTLLFGRRRGVDSGGSYPHRRPHSSCPCMLVLGGGGCGQMLCPRLQLPLITSQGGLWTSGKMSLSGKTLFCLPHPSWIMLCHPWKCAVSFGTSRKASLRAMEKPHSQENYCPSSSGVWGLQGPHPADFLSQLVWLIQSSHSSGRRK